LAAAGQAPAANLFVSPTGSDISCSQALPCTLSEALSQTADGDNLYLAGGTYTGIGSIVAQITETVVIRGGWDGTETTPPVVDPETYPTIIDGQKTRRVLEFTGTAAVVIGLTVKDGEHPALGGGILANGTALVLRDVIVDSCIVSNSSGNNTYGGGVHVR
jgi:hypothetical protein